MTKMKKKVRTEEYIFILEHQKTMGEDDQFSCVQVQIEAGRPDYIQKVIDEVVKDLGAKHNASVLYYTNLDTVEYYRAETGIRLIEMD
jgi:hypothetical protein